MPPMANAKHAHAIAYIFLNEEIKINTSFPTWHFRAIQLEANQSKSLAEILLS
jgi:hypothetical protein